jgi:hypothetical protein
MNISALGDARTYIVQGLHLQRAALARPETVGPVLEAVLEIAAEGEQVPPLGLVADVLNALAHADRGGSAAAVDLGMPVCLPAGLVRAYEDHVLSRLFGDEAIDRAADVWRRLQGRERARCAAYIIGRLRESVAFPGVDVNPSIVRGLLRESPEEVLTAGSAGVAEPAAAVFWAKVYEQLVTGFRGAGELLTRADVFELERGVALEWMGQRVALRQILRYAELVQAAIARPRARARSEHAEAPTRLHDEDVYPVGGYAALSQRGTIESLLPSQLAYMESDRPDLFDIKYVRDELLFFSRDENQHFRRRSTVVFALWPDLVQARFKDAELPHQRIVLLLGWLTAATRRLRDWLSDDALQIVMALVTGEAKEENDALAPERDLLRLIFQTEIAAGTVQMERVPDGLALAQLCLERARRSRIRCLSAGFADHRFEAKGLEVTGMQISAASPRWSGLKPAEGEDALGDWTMGLQAVMEQWL